MKKEDMVIGIVVLQAVLLLVLLVQTWNIKGNIDEISLNGAVVNELAGPGERVAQPPPPSPTVDVSVDDDPMKGKKNAPVTIIEFSDFQCPYCKKVFSETLPLLEKEYIDTGKVKFVYRDYPLPFHPLAQKTAEAAECADEQVKFWEYHDTIFENQDSLSVENLKSWAQDLGLDSEEFDQCLDSGEMASEVKKDMEEGQKYGVRGTPAFFINGKLLSGAQPYVAFQREIEAALQN
tara:strand:+ start:148 stop:852 length:705 start_codon:yes stop_codon:yes gene_type:complete